MLKTCTRCHECKDSSSFGPSKQHKCGLYPVCKTCCCLKTKAYVAKNKEKVATADRARYYRHRDKRLAAAKERFPLYYAQNKSKYRYYNFIRECRERNNTASMPSACEIRQRMCECGNICVYCGGTFEQIDHLVPVSKGGGNDLFNLVSSCRSCNSSKAAKEWLSWYMSCEFYNDERMSKIRLLSLQVSRQELAV